MTGELLNDFMQQLSGEVERPCQRCQKIWIPHGWNFYNLCNECFGEFDSQKMSGRLSGQSDYYENVQDWIEANPNKS